MNSMTIKSNTELGDIKRARSLMQSLIKTNPNSAAGWMSAARVEIVAGKLQHARNIIAQGCKNCPTNEDIWIEAVGLNNVETGKLIIAEAVRHIPNSIHLGCSEFFYKNNIEQEIKNKRITQEERINMLKFFSKFKYNEKSIENFEFLYDNEELLEKEQNELEERMKDINIENASFEEIWERLNSSEREEFVHLALAYNENE
ncbi:hypothetical protein PCK2_000308 [Pneumocystis canis]|nr:hypothetical protein PCK2_000308 [Pneumocystis canis]